MWTVGASQEALRKQLREGHYLFDYEVDENTDAVSVPTLAKSGPLVRGTLHYRSRGEETVLSLTTAINKLRLFGPTTAVLLLGLGLFLGSSDSSWQKPWAVIMTAVLLLAAIQSAFLGWAKRTLTTALEEELKAG